MERVPDSETFERLSLLFLSQPKEGSEVLYHDLADRELSRLVSRQTQEVEECPTADPEQVGRRDGTEVKGDSASETIIPKVY